MRRAFFVLVLLAAVAAFGLDFWSNSVEGDVERSKQDYYTRMFQLEGPSAPATQP